MSNLNLVIGIDANTAPLQEVRAQLISLSSALKNAFQVGGALGLAEKLRESLSAGLSFNAQLQELQRSLAAVSGSTSLASVRMAELHRLQGASRFNLGELAQVSRQLQVMTDGALASGHGLQLVADVASGTNSSLATTADAIGRVYGQIKAGDPEIQRGMQQLVMMGAINATTKNSIEALAKSGASSEQTWSALAAALARFGGQSAASTATMQGSLDQLHKAFEDACGSGTRALFEQLQPTISALTESLKNNGAREAIVTLGHSLGQITAHLAQLTAALATCAPAWGAITTAIQAFGAVKVAGWFSGWISNNRSATAAAVASTAALSAETAALGANTAARVANAAFAGKLAQARNIEAPFAPARLPERETGMRDPTTGRFRFDPQASGSMRTKTYAKDELDQTVQAFKNKMAAAASDAGTTSAQQFKQAMKTGMDNLGWVITAAIAGWNLGSLISKKMGLNSSSDYAEAKDLRESGSEKIQGYQATIAGLNSVAEKQALVKQLFAEINDLTKKSNSDNTSDAVQEVIRQQMQSYRDLLHSTGNISDSTLNDRAAKNMYDANVAQNKPISDQLVKDEDKKNAESTFDDDLEAAETYAEKLRVVQAELDKTTAAIDKMGDVENQTGDEGYAQTVHEFEVLQHKRRTLEKQQSGLGRESTKETTEKSTRMDEYQLELKILNLRNRGDEAGAKSAEKELAVRKKTAELLQIAQTKQDKDLAATRAKEFVDAEFSSKERQPAATAVQPQSDRWARVGLFVGGVSDRIAERGAAAAERSAQTLREVVSVLRDPRFFNPTAVYSP